MVAKYWPAGDGGGGPGLPSGPATASSGGRKWPLSARLRRRSDFERVYSSGRRFRCSLFTAIALLGKGSARVGFSVPRALGKAVVRNRLRRRLREAVRLHLGQLAPGWDVVFSPRPSAFEADFQQIEAEIVRYFASLKAPEDGRERS